MPREHRPEFLVWASFVPAYAAAVAVFFVAERYRVPLFVPLCVGAGACVDRAITAIASPDGGSSRRWLAMAGGAAALLLALVQWPVALSDSREGDRVRMAMHEMEAGRYDEAERWATLAIQASTSPDNVRATIGHGLVGRHPARALAYLGPVRQRGSRDPQVLLDFATVLKDTGNTAGALDVLQDLRFPPGTDVSLQLQAGRLAATLGAPDLALRLFRDVVRVRPDLAQAWAQLGFNLLVRGDLDEAARALAEAVRLNPRDAVALGGLAVCELRLGRREDALTHAAAALAIDPHEALATQVVAALKVGRGAGPPR
jgi:tetratricopeptide (TPR) repeat protein